jgi:hypothetical protein
MRANLKLVKPAPTPVNGTVPPRRACNAVPLFQGFPVPISGKTLMVTQGGGNTLSAMGIGA